MEPRLKLRTASRGWLAAMLVMCLLDTAHGQGTGWTWGYRLGGNLAVSSGGNGYDEPGHPAADAAGNVYVTGGYDSPATFGGSALTLPFAGIKDLLVTKYDSTGRLRWARSLGGSGNDKGMVAATDIAANVFVGGTTQAGFTLPSGAFMQRGGFLAKYDSAGTLLWTQHFGVRPTVGTPLSAATDYFGNCYVLISRSDSMTLGRFHLPKPLNTFFDIVLISYDLGGGVNWARPIGISSSNAGSVDYSAVTADGAGNIYVTATAGQGTVQFSPTLQASITARSGTFLVRYDVSGVPQWVRTAPLAAGTGLALDASGRNLYWCGNAATGATFGGSITPVISATAQDAFLARYSAQGVLDWVRTGGGANVPTEGNGIAVNRRGEAFLVAAVGDDPVSFGGASFAWPYTTYRSVLVKYDSLGTVRWAAATSIDGAKPVGLALAGEQGPVVVASSYRTVGLGPAPSVITLGLQDILVARADFRNRTLAVRTGAGPAAWLLYPNPATTTVAVTLPTGVVGATMHVTDIQGRAISTQWLTTSNNYRLIVSGWPAGVYIVTLQSVAGVTIGAKRLVVK